MYVCTAIPAFIIHADKITCLIWPVDEQFTNFPDHVLLFSSALSETVSIVHYLVGNLVYGMTWLSVTICNCIMYYQILRALHNRKQNTQQLNLSSGFEKQLRQVAVMVIAIRNGLLLVLFHTSYQFSVRCHVFIAKPSS